MTVGERIREKRKACGLTMAELGNKIGVTAAAISRYELGQREMSLDTIQSIATALNIHIFDLVGIGEELDKYRVECDSIKPISGRSEDLTPEKLAEAKRILSAGPRESYDNISDEEKLEFWKIISQADNAPNISIDTPRSRIISLLDKLNPLGMEKAADSIEIIAGNPKYQAQQPPVPTSGDNDTTPPTEPTEGPSEDG